ncbi:putative RNA helicase, partial [Coemansia sp. RSA 1804]
MRSTNPRIYWRNTHTTNIKRGDGTCRKPDKGFLTTSDFSPEWRNIVATVEIKGSDMASDHHHLRGQILQNFIDMAELQPRRFMIGLSLAGNRDVRLYVCVPGGIYYTLLGRLPQVVPTSSLLTPNETCVITFLLFLHSQLGKDCGYLTRRNSGLPGEFSLADIMGIEHVESKLPSQTTIYIDYANKNEKVFGRHRHLNGQRTWAYPAQYWNDKLNDRNAAVVPGELSPAKEKEHDAGKDKDEYRVPPMRTFAELGLDQWLVDSLSAMAIKQPTEIQRACIGPILEGRDVIGGAQTGSGKTAAFALPVLQRLSEDPYGVFAVVLTPTRELACQIAEQFEVLGKGAGVRVTVTIGGVDMVTQAIEMSRRPHIVVGTPGRLADLIQSSSDAVHLQRVRFLVLDEADRLLTDTFAPDLDVIMRQLPKTRNTLLFTATMTSHILALRNKPAAPPFVHVCKSDVVTVSSLVQYYMFVPSHVKEAYLVHLLKSNVGRLEKRINTRLADDAASDSGDDDGQEGGEAATVGKDKSIIIFVGQCKAAETLRVMLFELGFRVTALHSRMAQRERLASLGKFKAQAVRILVATDVGSRGLDIPSVDL